jgi:hypothetical protein
VIDILIYDSGARGQEICDQWGIISPEDQREVLELCNHLGTAAAEQAGASLRFASLKSGRYLFSLIKYLPPTEQLRAHNRVLSCVMDTPEIDVLLSRKFEDILSTFSAIAAYSAQDIYRLLNQQSGLKFLKAEPKGTQPASDQALAILVGAMASNPQKKSCVVYGTEQAQYGWLDWLMQRLPVSLRRQVSFHSDIQCAADATGVSLFFCSETVEEGMRSSAYSGMERADVCVCSRQGFQDCISMQRDIQCAREILSQPMQSWKCCLTVFPTNGTWETFRQALAQDWSDLSRVISRCGKSSSEQQLTALFELYPAGMQEKAWTEQQKFLKRYPELYRTLSERFAPSVQPDSVESRHGEPNVASPAPQPPENMHKQSRRLPASPVTILRWVLILLLLLLAVLLAGKGLAATREEEQVRVITVTVSAVHYLLRTGGIVVLSFAAGVLFRGVFSQKNRKKDQ